MKHLRILLYICPIIAFALPHEQFHWSMDKIQDQTIIPSRGKIKGSIVGDLSLNEITVKGHKKKALKLYDDVSELQNYLEVINPEEIDVSKGFTINLWVQIRGGKWSPIFRIENDDLLFNIATKPDEDKLRVSIKSKNTDKQNFRDTVSPIKDNEWHMLTYIFDPSEAKSIIYIDAMPEIEFLHDIPIELEHFYAIYFGSPYNQNKLDATLDELYFFNHALMERDIENLYKR